jgi:hypothetical protein
MKGYAAAPQRMNLDEEVILISLAFSIHYSSSSKGRQHQSEEKEAHLARSVGEWCALFQRIAYVYI